MRIRPVILLVLQAAIPAQQKRVEWVPNPRPSGGWVADPSHHLKQATIDSLNAMASALERETSDEIAVVIVDSTKGLEPEDFALAIHRAWGVGKGTRDNGVVVLWAPPQRALYVSVGYGLEGRLIDGRVGRIRDEEFFPAFKANEFDRGMLDGVAAIVAAAREEGVPIDRIKEPAKRSNDGKPNAGRVFAVVGSVIAVVLAFAGLFAWIGYIRHRRFRHCPKCGARMRYIEDPAERTSLLDAGQRVEERLGTVHHDFWVCPKCATHDTDSHIHHREISPCSRCDYRTLEREVRTVVVATTLHEGENLVTYHCANCGYSREESVVTPRVVADSGGSGFGGGGGSGGSSGGGGGSFGGGSAGGGGAGGHY